MGLVARVPLQISGQARNRAQGVCVGLQGHSLGGPRTQQILVLVAVLRAGPGQSSEPRGERRQQAEVGSGVSFQSPLQVGATGRTYSHKTRCDNACEAWSPGVSWRPSAQGFHWGPVMRGPLPGTRRIRTPEESTGT